MKSNHTSSSKDVRSRNMDHLTLYLNISLTWLAPYSYYFLFKPTSGDVSVATSLSHYHVNLYSPSSFSSLYLANTFAFLLFQFYFLKILLQYYIERQCLLKCTKRILTHACKFFRWNARSFLVSFFLTNMVITDCGFLYSIYIKRAKYY